MSRASCIRCGHPCQLAAPTQDRPDIVLLRGKSTPGGGVCPSCAITGFLQDPGCIIGQLFAEMSPERRGAALALPHLQAQVCVVVEAQPGGVGVDPAEIVWERVAANWELPMPALARKRRRR